MEAVSVKIIPLKYRVEAGGLYLIQLEDLCNFYTKNLVDRVGKYVEGILVSFWIQCHAWKTQLI